MLFQASEENNDPTNAPPIAPINDQPESLITSIIEVRPLSATVLNGSEKKLVKLV
ncbi:hypothetical protein D3C78_1992090 [compost metagenome]